MMRQQHIVDGLEQARRLDRLGEHAVETGFAVRGLCPVPVVIGDGDDRNFRPAPLHRAHAPVSTKLTGRMTIDVDEHHVDRMLLKKRNSFGGGLCKDRFCFDNVEAGLHQLALQIVFFDAQNSQGPVSLGQIDHKKAMMPMRTCSSVPPCLVSERLTP